MKHRQAVEPVGCLLIRQKRLDFEPLDGNRYPTAQANAVAV